MSDNEISFDKAKYDGLVKAYNKAVKQKKESFTYLELEWVTDYAKYVIEYLDPKFKTKK